jgi:hypothetical protein
MTTNDNERKTTSIISSTSVFSETVFFKVNKKVEANLQTQTISKCQTLYILLLIIPFKVEKRQLPVRRTVI